MVGCSIRHCKSRSVKGGSIRFFSFPLKESVANEWLRYCGPKTTTKNGRVCSNHFLPSDYFKSLQHILLNESPRKVRNLKPDAVPTLQINDKDSQNTLSKSIKIEIEVDIEGTSGNIHECSTTPANEVANSSNVVEKSVENVTIPLAEYKQLKRNFNKYDVLKKKLEKIFTPGQIRCLMKPYNKRRVKWSAQDITAAISFRSIITPKGYRHLRATGIPLPAFSTLRNWVSKFKIKKELLEDSD